MIEKIYELVKKSLPEEVDFTVEPASDSKFGHYATNVAMRLAPGLKKPPLEIAADLAKRIKNSDREGLFQEVRAAAPGFINFWLSPEVFFSELKSVLKKKERYIDSDFGRGQKIQIDFISANPTGPLTLANGRGGFFGAALSAVLDAAGYKVEREYYVNDTGKQIITLGKSLIAALGLMPYEENFYQGGYIKVWAAKNGAFVEKNKDKPLKIGQKAAEHFLKLIKKAVSVKAGIKIDRWTSEDKDIHKKGLTDKALKIFKEKDLIYEKEGAVWLKTTEFGDDKDRVLITSDKFPTYFLADAGHYLETKKRGFHGKILILGPDHYGYVNRIQAVAKILGLEKSEVIITQAVRLISGGTEVKMSKRKGTFVTFEELIDEVGSDPAKFFFLAHAAESHMDFDLDLAKKRSPDNPVYYLQYAYVRAKSILKKSGKAASGSLDFNLLSGDSELNLIKEIIKLPDLVKDAARDLRVHRLTQYASALAKAFHNFYEREQVLVPDKKLKAARISLVRAGLISLSAVLDLLGLSKPDKM